MKPILHLNLSQKIKKTYLLSSQEKLLLLGIKSFLVVIMLFFQTSVYAQAPTVPSTNLTFSNLDGDRFIARFTRGNGQNRIIIASESPVTAIPVNGADYLDGNFGLGNEISPGQFVVYKGNADATWLYGFNHSTTYYLKIFEYNGSNFSTEYLTDQFLEGSVNTLTGPTVQASNLTFSNITGSSMTLNWTKGDGTSRMVVARVDAAVDAEPVDLTNYFDSTSFGSGSQISPGNYVVYQGTGASMNLSNLAPNRTYHFSIFEYNGSSGKIYLRPGGAIGNQLTVSAPTLPATNFSTRSVDGNRFIYDFIKGNGTNRLVIAKKGSPVTAVPEDGGTYTASETFGSGTEILPGEFVVYNSSSTASWIYGLEPNTIYHFAVFEHNGNGAFYLTDPYLTGTGSTLTGPAVQASNLTFSNITGSSMTLNWTKGDGTSRMVVARVDAAVDAEPVDLTNYFGSTSFGNGSQISPGNYVVYQGTGASMNLTNLAPNKTYHFSIFEYNGSSGKIYLRPGGAIGNQLTVSAPTLPATNFSTRSVDGNRFIYDFIKGNGTNRLVIAKKGSPVTAVPEDGGTYTASETFGSGTEILPGEFVVYNSSSTASWIYGLEPNTIYHFAVFEHNGNGAFYLIDPYLAATGSTLSSPTVQSSNAFISSRSNTSINISWTKGNGTNRLLIGRKDGPVNVAPEDFTNYSVSSSFGTREIGTGNYLLYQGTGNNVNVTNLEASTNYHFALFEYNGSSAKLYLRPGYVFALETFGERPTLQVSNASYDAIDFNSFDVNFTPGNGTRRLVLARAGAPVNAGPADFATYSANSSFGQGDQIGTGNFVVYNDFGENFSLNNLDAGITYHFAFFEYALSEQGELYLSPAYTSSQSTKENYDLALTTILTPISGCDLSGAEAIQVEVTNLSSTPVDAFSLAYSINGGTPVIEELAEENLISGNGSLTYTFNQTANLSAKDTYEITAFLVLAGDVNSSNDQFTFIAENYPEPVTTITENTSIIEGESILLEATGGTSYLWSTGETTTSITVQPVETTEYSVVITDGNGCSVVRTVTVEVIPDPCSAVTCPPGFGCVQGGCYIEFYSITGTVRDLVTNTALSGVLVGSTAQSNPGEEIFSDENGNYSISVSYEGVITFSKSGYEVFTSDPILEATSGLDVLLQPTDDLCAGVTCPPGFGCVQGGCYIEFYSITGTVRDFETNTALSGVLVGSTAQSNPGEEIFSDENGNYSISVSYEGVITFSKSGYEVFTSDPILEATSGLDVLLQPTDDLCAGVTCPPGFGCVQGGCYIEFYSITGTVRDLVTNEPIAGVLVDSEGKAIFGVDILTDAQGNFSIDVQYNSIITFSKPGYTNGAFGPVTEAVSGIEIQLELSDPLCVDLNCPPGFVCVQGTCILSSIPVSGTVWDAVTGHPLPEVRVFTESSFQSVIKSNGNGFYSIDILPGEVIYFSLQGYESFSSQPVLEETSGLDVWLQPTDPCDNITCGPGLTCLQGECYGIKLISGVVRDEDTNDPISNVRVYSFLLDIFQEETFTDENGYYEINIIESGNLRFTKIDYLSKTIINLGLDGSNYDLFLKSSLVDPCEGLFCPVGQTCVGGECKLACSQDMDCPPGTVCAGGACLTFDELCLNTQCPEGTVCLNGRCITEEDLCFNKTCPEGTYCLDGNCIVVNDPFLTIAGTVRDKISGNVIPNIEIEVGDNYKTVFSRSDGTYTAKVPFGFSLNFSKWDYIEFNSPPMSVSRSNYDVELYKNWCLVHDCQPGQQCVNGRCETIFYTVSGTVRDELTNEPIPNATVFTPGSETQTNEIGAYSIQVILNNAIQFSKEGFSSQQTPNISADNFNYNVLLGPDPCESISCESGFKCENGECVPDPCATSNCQPDELCFNGSCFPYPDLTIYGTVKDINTGEPIAAAAVVNSNPTLVDYNGYFIVQVPFGDQILFIAEGYQWEYSPVMTQDFAVLEIFMTPDAECDDIVCPDGKICNNGICIDPCSDLDCPPGYACLGGQCFQVACTSSLTSLQVSPTIGTSDTEYTFTITYTDPSNAHLLVGYPRLELDANNNGSAEDPGDLMLAMTEIDPSDLDFTDGKIYQVTVSGLSDNTTWKARVVTKNEFNCQVSTEFINEPNVSVSNLDVAIFANNITFTNDTPNTDEAITMFARVRNISDFPADNFIVSAYDGETQIFTTTVDNLEENSNIDLSWVYSFAEPGFYPIRVVIDETDVLDEINELNNFAIRPVIVGNYVLPGGIQATAAPNTTTVYAGDWINISGYASYFGIDEGINPDVAGANISFSYENGTFQTTTSSNGTYSRSLNMPSIPGVYTFTGAVTDYTLTGEIPSFQVEVIPLPDKADLKASITLDQSEVVEGEEITGVATVTNIGELTATNFTFRYSSCEGVLGEVDINSMAPGETLSFNFAVTITDEIGSCLNKNNCSFIAIADVYNEVDDRSRSNNTAGKSITIYPILPDLTPRFSSIGFNSTMVEPFNFTVRVDNIGAEISNNAFVVNVYVDDALVDTRSFDNLERCDKISYPLTVEFDTQEDHEIRIKVDEPLGSGNIEEFNEDNNEFIRLVRYNPPPELKPNLYITKTYLSVDPGLPVEGENFLIKARVRNTGQAPIQEAFDVNFQITEDGVPRNETLTVSEGLAANAELLLEHETSLATYGNHTVLVDLDPLNLIDETIEFDNKASMPLCVDFEVGQSGSVWNGGFIVDTEQNLSGRVRNLGLFTATNVRVDFLLDGSEIGSTIIPELSPTYNSIGMLVSIPYTFRDVGTHQLEMVVDRNDLYIECDETNNAIAKDIVVRAPQPDLRILSEYIAPTSLNPELDEEINLFITYENIGANTTLPFKIRVTVDDVPLGEDIVVDGLGAGQLATVPVGTPYSSATPGVKVIRGFVDLEQEADDLNYNNNEASRAVVVGAAPNLLFTRMDFSNYCPQVGELVQINVEIENEGDLGADAEVHFYYVTENNTVPIDMVPITTDLQSSTSASITYTVINPEYQILAEIKNSTIQEFNDLDNAVLGEFVDTIAPNLSIPADLTINKDEVSCEPIEIELGQASASDNCSEVTIINNAPELFPIGETEVIWTAIDGSGNATELIQLVTITANGNETSIDNSITQVSGVLISNQAGATYQWYRCPNTLLSEETNQSFTPTENGDYKVEIILGNCIVESACLTVEGLSIDDVENTSHFSMYPNPASDLLYINTDFEGTFKIINQIGQIVQTFKVDPNNVNVVNVKNLADGVYYIKGKSELSNRFKKLIIKK